MESLISIIIPTFNRAALIGETLDSILTQTYTNWECLVIDDGSTDKTDLLLLDYCKKDKRFKYHHRPKNRSKGANACRNIGLELAKGDFVIFFDSDDLMTNDHIQIKLDAIKKYKCDYIITRTKFLNDDSTNIDRYYNFDKYRITPYNYISQNINWLTYDCFLITSLAKKIKFNESLQSGQEYNYFSKLVYESVNAVFVNKVVTLRRKHEESIRSKLKTRKELNLSAFKSFWLTYLDVKNSSNKKVKLFQLKFCVKKIYEEKEFLAKNKLLFCMECVKVLKFKSIYFFLMLMSLKSFGKGHYFIKKCFKP